MVESTIRMDRGIAFRGDFDYVICADGLGLAGLSFVGLRFVSLC
jgi:hypothetical protein